MVATVECPATAPVFATAAEPIAGAELTAHELAIDCLRHASALWRGDAIDEAFGRWLSGYWCRALPPEPARSPDAVSPHCAGAHGIRWYESRDEVWGYVPGVSGGYRIPRTAAPPV